MGVGAMGACVGVCRGKEGCGRVLVRAEVSAKDFDHPPLLERDLCLWTFSTIFCR